MKCNICEKLFQNSVHYILHMRFFHSQLLEPQHVTVIHEEPDNQNDIEEEDMCRICMVKKRDSVMYPCGHMHYCIACANRVYQSTRKPSCPTCRNPIKDVIKVFK